LTTHLFWDKMFTTVVAKGNPHQSFFLSDVLKYLTSMLTTNIGSEKVKIPALLSDGCDLVLRRRLAKLKLDSRGLKYVFLRKSDGFYKYHP